MRSSDLKFAIPQDEDSLKQSNLMRAQTDNLVQQLSEQLDRSILYEFAVKIISGKNRLSFEPSFNLMKECDTYQEYTMQHAIRGLEDEILYSEDQFRLMRKLYLSYFKGLEK